MKTVIQGRLYFSNSFEKLAAFFRENLFSNSYPFEHRIVITPNKAVQEWLNLYLSVYGDVSMGIDFCLLGGGIRKLQTQPINNLPSRMELALAIEAILRKILSKGHPTLAYRTLQEYFDSGKDPQKTIVKLACHLADLFLRYGLYGKALIQKWEQDTSSHWQSEIWNELYTNKELSYPYRAYQNPIGVMNPHTSVHLFGFSYLSPAHTDFFLSQINNFPIFFYSLTPSILYWADTQTVYEQKKLQQILHAKGVKESELFQLSEYLEDANTLLANMGKLGREWLRAIDEYDLISTEQFFVPQSVITHPIYQNISDREVILESENTKQITLLDSLKLDILSFRKETDQQVSFDDYDQTIQIHVSSSRQREIEILYDNLCSLLNNSKNASIHLRDIKVYAPNIGDYLPYIEAIFGDANSLFKFRIEDISLLSTNSLAKIFMRILDIGKHRLEPALLKPIFLHPVFLETHNLLKEDVESIFRYLEEMKVTWGKNNEERHYFLEMLYQQKLHINDSWHMTFEKAFETAFKKYFYYEEDNHLISSRYELSITEAAALGEVIRLFDALMDDVTYMQQSFLTIEDWAFYFQTFLYEYFGSAKQNSKYSKEFQQLISQINKLGQVKSFFQETTYSFATIYHHIELMLNEKIAIIGEQKDIEVIAFASLKPMGAVPAEITAVLGLNEEVFPRKYQSDATDALPYFHSVYVPKPFDYDRYLFLEILLVTKQYLLFSALKQSPLTYESSSLSLILEELMYYLDQSATISGKLPSQYLLHQHPFSRYHYSYFDEKQANYRCFSKERYQQALQFYKSKKELKKPFYITSPPTLSTKVLPDSFEVVSLQDLKYLCSNPLKLYFNYSLNIFLRDEDLFTEPLKLSGLISSIIQKKSLKKSHSDWLSHTNFHEWLPIGSLGNLAKDSCLSMIENLHKALYRRNISSDSIYTFVFDLHLEKSLQLGENTWGFPPLKIQRQGKPPCLVVGKISNLSKQGLLYLGKESLARYLSLWPELLALSTLQNQRQLPMDVANQIVLLLPDQEKPFYLENHSVLWEVLIDYYYLACSYPSPILADWLEWFLSKSSKELQQRVLQAIGNVDHLYNPYLKWTLPTEKDLLSTESLEQWAVEAKKVFEAPFILWKRQTK